MARHRPGLRRVQVRRRARRRTASCRSTATRTTRPAARSSSRCTTTSGGRPGSTRSPRALPPGETDEEVDRAGPRAVRRRPRRPRGLANNSRWISFTTVRNEHLAARQRRPARRRRAHRALLDRLGHEAGDGGRARAGRLPARGAGRSTRALAAYEAERRPVVLSTQRAAQASLEWFENLGQYVAPGADAVRVQHHDPQPPGHLRQPAPARPGVRRGSTSGSPTTSVRAGRRARGEVAAADVPAVPARRAGACTTASSCPRWTCTSPSTACPTTSTSLHLGGKALGGAGLVMTEMVCVSPGGPDHARAAPGCTTDEHEAALAADRRLRARAVGGQDRPPARPLRPQGLDQAHVGGHRRAAATTATGRSSAPSPLPYRAGVNQVPRELTRDELAEIRERVRRRRRDAAPAPASTCSSCTARTATCCRRSSRR